MTMYSVPRGFPFRLLVVTVGLCGVVVAQSAVAPPCRPTPAPTLTFGTIDVSGGDAAPTKDWQPKDGGDGGEVDVRTGLNFEVPEHGCEVLVPTATEVLRAGVYWYRQVGRPETSAVEFRKLVLYVEGDVTIHCRGLFSVYRIARAPGYQGPVSLRVYAGAPVYHAEGGGVYPFAIHHRFQLVDFQGATDASGIGLPGGRFFFHTRAWPQQVAGNIRSDGGLGVEGGDGGAAGQVTVLANQALLRGTIEARGGVGSGNANQPVPGSLLRLDYAYTGEIDGGDGGAGGSVALAAAAPWGNGRSPLLKVDVSGGEGGTGRPGPVPPGPGSDARPGGKGGKGGSGGAVSVFFAEPTPTLSVDVSVTAKGGPGGAGGNGGAGAPTGGDAASGGDGGDGGAAGEVERTPVFERVEVQGGSGGPGGAGGNGGACQACGGGDGGDGGNGGMGTPPGQGGQGGKSGNPSASVPAERGLAGEPGGDGGALTGGTEVERRPPPTGPDQQHTPAFPVLAGMEVVQVIQNWHNSVPLLMGKPTFVRVYFDSSDGVTEIPVTRRLQIYRGALEDQVLLREVEPINGPVRALTDAIAGRDDWERSLNFAVPAELLREPGSLSFHVTLQEGCDATEPPCADHAQTLEVKPLPRLPLIFHALEVETPDGRVVRTPEELLDEQFASLIARIESVFPCEVIPSSGPDVRRWFRVREHPLMLQQLVNCGDRTRFAAVALHMQATQAAEVVHVAVLPRDYLPPAMPGTGGVVDGAALSSRSGREGLRLIAVADKPQRGMEWFGRLTHVHELGHALGLAHPAYGADRAQALLMPELDCETGELREVLRCRLPGPCGSAPCQGQARAFPFADPDGRGNRPLLDSYGGSGGLRELEGRIYGLDLLSPRFGAPGPWSPTVISPNTPDLMSYCEEPGIPWRWISEHHYNAVYALMSPRYLRGPALRTPLPSQLLVSGSVSPSAGTLDPLSRPVRSLAHADLQADPFRVRAWTKAGDLLATVRFAPDPAEFEGAEELTFSPTSRAFFAVPIDDHPALGRISLETAAGHELASLRISASRPTVRLDARGLALALSTPTLTTPEFKLQWSGADADGDPLTYTVEFSRDDGANWSPVATLLQEAELRLSLTDLPATERGRFRITASDGYHLGVDSSTSPIVIPNTAPRVSILAPGDAHLALVGQTLAFRAQAGDRDEPLADDRIRWTSSLDGFLGQGRALERSASGLTPGEHLVTVSATDSAGASASASIRITVALTARPALQIRPGATPGTVVVAWSPASAKLESTPHLQPPVPWRRVLAAPDSDRLAVTPAIVTLQGEAQFFRVQQDW